MADKSFGVKELNLLNASGTPTVTSPNNLNLNANTVAISTSATVGNNLTVSGQLNVGNNIKIGNAGVVTATSFVGNGAITINNNGTSKIITGSGTANTLNGNVNLTFDGTTLDVKSGTGNVNAGIVTATTFSGSGASLTNLPASDPTATDVQVAYELLSTSASGAGWRITGNGIVNTVNNPDLHLIRGQKYRFINNSGGSHPFRIQSDSSTAYDTGVTNNNASSGNIDFVPRNDAPARLYYNCTNHGGMLGNIYMHGAGGGRGILTQNTTLTGSSLTYDGIPTWATKITVNLLEASLSGSDQIYVRLRAGSSSISSDYSCVSGNFQGNLISSKTDAFNINTTGDAQLLSGSMVIEKIDSAGLKYVQTHMLLCTNNNSRHGGGNLERSSGAAVDGIEITVEGSNTFDNGVVTIYYE